MSKINYIKSSIIIACVLMLILIGCNKQVLKPSLNSDLYDFCIENNGTVIDGITKQCNYQKLIYFQSTDNTINIQFCKSYYDGCNTCSVEDGIITGCTEKFCNENEGAPRCLQFNETSMQSDNIIYADFICDNGVLKTAFDNKNHIVNITYDDKIEMLSQVISASGAKYSDQKITFFTKGNNAFLTDAKNESLYIFNDCIVD